MGPFERINNAGGFDSRIFTKIQKKFFGPFSFIRYIKPAKIHIVFDVFENEGQGIPKCHFNNGTFYRIIDLFWQTFLLIKTDVI